MSVFLLFWFSFAFMKTFFRQLRNERINEFENSMGEGKKHPSYRRYIRINMGKIFHISSLSSSFTCQKIHTHADMLLVFSFFFLSNHYHHLNSKFQAVLNRQQPNSRKLWPFFVVACLCDEHVFHYFSNVFFLIVIVIVNNLSSDEMCECNFFLHSFHILVVKGINQNFSFSHIE